MSKSNKEKVRGLAGKMSAKSPQYQEYWTTDKKLDHLSRQNTEIIHRLKVLKYLVIVIVSLLSASILVL